MGSFAAILRNVAVLRKHDVNFAKRCRPEGRAATKTPPNIIEEKPPCLLEDAAREWLDSSRSNIKRSTFSTYSVILQRHILPQFGKCPVSDITLDDISSFVYGKTFSDESEALASSTVRGIITVLRSVFRFAESSGCRVLSWGNIHRPTLTAGESRILTDKEQQLLREYLCRDMTFEKLGVLICLYTGLRLGEICAMKWGDISLETGTISVKRTVQRIKNPDYEQGKRLSKTKVIFDVPKSRSSSRSIPVPSFLLDIVKKFRRGGDCFILTGVSGSFLEPRLFQNHYKKLLEEAGVEYLNFHALRHPYVKPRTKNIYCPKAETLCHQYV